MISLFMLLLAVRALQAALVTQERQACDGISQMGEITPSAVAQNVLLKFFHLFVWSTSMQCFEYMIFTACTAVITLQCPNLVRGPATKYTVMDN